MSDTLVAGTGERARDAGTIQWRRSTAWLLFLGPFFFLSYGAANQWAAELEQVGLVPFHSGDPADGAILQADHAEYASWGPSDIVGIRCLVDGRGVTTDSQWPGVEHLVIGRSA